MSKYYDKNGYLKEDVFEKELSKIHNQIENGADFEELKKIRRRLYYLKSQYEKSGCRNIEIEFEIRCVNEFLYY